MAEQRLYLERRSVGEWSARSGRAYGNAFTDVTVAVHFDGPSGRTFRVPAFYDGDSTWRVRFSPSEAGVWRYAWRSWPVDAELVDEGTFEVAESGARGYLQARPGFGWGLAYESGEPAFILGDTTYNLFGMAHCGADVGGFMRRRAAQGLNLLRVRLPVSPFHPPEGYSHWQTRRTWPWGGSEQSPRFDRFNLDYFRTVDRVVALAEELGLGLEMIMEAWGFEFPFNSRQLFVPEWEELWLRYLIARYDAYSAVYFWTLQNEYEYYPNGDWHHKPVADRWAMRVGRWVKGMAAHGHIVAVHNGPTEPPFAQRFAADPGAIDAVMFQAWGTTDAEQGWLAAGIEDSIAQSLDGWWGAAVFAEWGYERNPVLPLNIPGHAHCDVEHTRRGAWRGAFCGLGLIHGFENSWGPFMDLEHDQPGLAHLLHVRRFFIEIAPFHRLRPAPEVVAGAAWPHGHRPLALASPEGDLVAVYLPVGGVVALTPPRPLADYRARWYDPVQGALREAETRGEGAMAPQATHGGHPQDWVLLLEARR